MRTDLYSCARPTSYDGDMAGPRSENTQRACLGGHLPPWELCRHGPAPWRLIQRRATQARMAGRSAMACLEGNGATVAPSCANAAAPGARPFAGLGWPDAADYLRLPALALPFAVAGVPALDRVVAPHPRFLRSHSRLDAASFERFSAWATRQACRGRSSCAVHAVRLVRDDYAGAVVCVKISALNRAGLEPRQCLKVNEPGPAVFTHVGAGSGRGLYRSFYLTACLRHPSSRGPPPE